MPLHYREKYLSLFVSEARGHIAQVSGQIAAVPRDAGPEPTSALGQVYRSFHTLKGMAATLAFDGIFILAHELEDLCEAVRRGVLAPDDALVDLLKEGVDRLAHMVDVAAAGEEPDPAPDLEQAIRVYLRREGTTGFTVVEPAPEPAPEPEPEPVEDASLSAIAELMAVAQRLRALPRGEGEPVAEAARIEAAARTIFAALARSRQVGFDTVVPLLRRQFRKVCAREQKEANIEVTGGATLVDPEVLGLLQGALVQLLNNAIVHGLEAPAERRRLAKPPMGLVRLVVEREGETLRLSVHDDGAGFQVAALLALSRERAAVPPGEDERTEHLPTPPSRSRPPRGEAAMAAAITYAFTSGVSTRSEAGPDAGRGEGLGAVRHAVESIGGTLEITSVPGRGTSFLLVVPVQQRFEDLILVQEHDHAWAIPARLVLDTPDSSALRLRAGGQVRVGRVLGTVEALVSPARFPFSLLPRVTGTTVGPNGTILFVMDPPLPGARA